MEKIASELRGQFQTRLNSLYENISKEYTDELELLHGPFLISVTEEYANMKPRVIIVGQETGWWPNYKDYCTGDKKIEDMLKAYWAYNFGVPHSNPDVARKYLNFRHVRKNTSPFWNLFRSFVKCLCNDVHGSILWQNLIKFDYNGASVFKASEKVQERVFQIQNGLFREEIKILSPDVILFFTGPKYDGVIKKYYPNSMFDEVRKPEKVYRVKHPDLPELAFRTYHPKYLYLKRMQDRTIDLIHSEIIKSRM